MADQSQVLEKKCTACGAIKPCDQFNKSRNRDGLCNQCKQCVYARGQSLRKQKQARAGGDHIPALKQCAKCGEVKPAAEFAVYRAANDGLGRYCRECDSAVSRSRRYGIPEDRVRLMASRKTCESCGEPFASSKQQHFDHRHSDGAVRGVLCQKCNSVAGISDESPLRLMAVVEYLQRTKLTDYRIQPYLEQNACSPANSHAEPFTPEGTADTCQTNTTNQ